MSEQTDSADSQSILDRHHLLLRRLHSLSGIVPVGIFVIFHLFTNMQMIWPDGGAMFQHEVDFIHSLPALLFIEIGLWGGIGFHAALGLVYTFTGKSNVDKYKYADNWRYTVQRVTGIIALIFIFMHVATLRWRWSFGFFTPFYGSGHDVPGLGHSLADVGLAMPLTAYALQYSWLIVLGYIIGALSVVYHWSNGLWTAAITWGVTITEAAQRKWGYVCAALGIALTVFTVGALAGALSYDLNDQPTDKQVRAMMVAISEKHLRSDLKAYWTEQRGIAVPEAAESEEAGHAGEQTPHEGQE